MNELVTVLEKEKNNFNFRKYEIEAEYYRNMAEKVYDFFHKDKNLQLDLKDSYQVLVEICQMPPMGFIENPTKYKCFLDNKSLLFVFMDSLIYLSDEDIQKLAKAKIYNFLRIFNSLNTEEANKQNFIQLFPLFHEIWSDFLSFFLTLNEKQRLIFCKYLVLNSEDIPAQAWTSEDSKNFYNKYEEYARLKERQLRQKRKEILNKQKAYESVIQKLKQIPSSHYIQLTESEIDSLSVNHLELVFQFILSNNQLLYHECAKQLDILNGQAENRLNEIFMAHQIPLLKEKENISKVLQQDEVEIQNRVLWVQNHYSKLEEKSLVELLICPQEIYNRFLSFGNLGYFTDSYMEKNLILLLNPNIQAILLKNVEILTRYSIYCKGLNEILFSPNIMENVSLAQHYHLDVANRNVFQSIMDPAFFDTYDIWIENGIEGYWFQNYSVIKDDIQNITKRILISFAMQLQPFDKEGNLQDFVLSAKNFSISDKELDQYLPHTNINFMQSENKMILDQSSRKNIEEGMDLFLPESSNPLCYCVGNLILSKPKVLRNLQALEDKSLLDAILYGSILSSSQCLEIINQMSILKSTKLARQKK